MCLLLIFSYHKHSDIWCISHTRGSNQAAVVPELRFTLSHLGWLWALSRGERCFSLPEQSHVLRTQSGAEVGNLTINLELTINLFSLFTASGCDIHPTSHHPLTSCSEFRKLPSRAHGTFTFGSLPLQSPVLKGETSRGRRVPRLGVWHWRISSWLSAAIGAPPWTAALAALHLSVEAGMQWVQQDGWALTETRRDPECICCYFPASTAPDLLAAEMSPRNHCWASPPCWGWTSSEVSEWRYLVNFSISV